MASNKEFQEHLQAGRISDAISLLINQLVEVDVVTELLPTEDSAITASLRTQISLLTGKATTVISPELAKNESYQKLLEFHTAQIEVTNQVVQGHLHSLKELLPILHPTTPTNAATVTPVKTLASADSSPPPVSVVVEKAKEQKPKLMVTTSDANPAGISQSVQPVVSIVSVTPAAPKVEKPATPIVEAVSTPVVSEETAVNSSATPTPPVTPISPAAPGEAKTNSPLPPPAIKAPEASTPSDVKNSKPTTVAAVSAGVIASGMAAAVAKAGSPKLEEAETIPNKFDQVLKSVGIKEEDDENPFMSDPAPTSPLVRPTTGKSDVDVAQLLNESDEEWDNWLLEEDDILSELSQASQEVTKDKIPDWDETWFAQPGRSTDSKAPITAEDWEQFIPEFTDLDVPTSKGQANVERFRQNLVNDPQLMNELLAELDDIEKMNKENKSKSERAEG